MFGLGRPLRLLFLLTAALSPLVLLPLLLSRSVDPLARVGARWLGQLCTRVPASIAMVAKDRTAEPAAFALATAGGEPEVPGASRTEGSDVASSRGRRRWRGAREGRTAGGRARVEPERSDARRIFVGPDLIRRALPTSGRPVAEWTNRTDAHPAGMVISQPGSLAGTIRAGDILFEAEGAPLTSFEQVVAIVAQRYERGARFVSGRLFRGGEAWVVTVEPGWVIRSATAGH